MDGNVASRVQALRDARKMGVSARTFFLPHSLLPPHSRGVDVGALFSTLAGSVTNPQLEASVRWCDYMRLACMMWRHG